MNVALLVLGALVTLVPTALSVGRPVLKAGTIIWVARVTIPLGFLLIQTALLATAIPAILEVLSLSGIATLCERVIHHMVVGGSTGALVGGVLSVGLGLATLRGVRIAKRNQLQAYVDEGIGTHLDGDDCTLVLLPTDASVAFAVPGSPPQLVLSVGAARRLSDAERQVVLEHERAHLRSRHFIDLALINAAGTGLGWIPGLSRGLGLWREALEWHSDDQAAVAVSSRSLVASTIKTWLGASPRTALSFDGVEHLTRRLDYLSGPPRESGVARLLTWAAVALLLASAGYLIVRWLIHAHVWTLGASFCPV